MIAGLVSTIIPVFNRAAMLREAVASVLAQDYQPIEIIIVDDGSTDGTLAVAHALRDASPAVIRVVSQVNGGPGAARQAGLEVASGEFIQFLDSDDLLLPEKFALQVTGLQQDGEAGISYGKTYTREHGIRAAMPAQRSAERHREIFPALLSGRLWETSTPLYRRSALSRIGPWPQKRQMEDWQFDAQAGAARIKLHHCDAYVAEYRIHHHQRLAHAWITDPGAMRDRIDACLEILKFARAAKVTDMDPEMQYFARMLFRMAREAGARGFRTEAEELLQNVQRISAGRPGRALEVWLYRRLAASLGWRAISALARGLD